MVDWALAQRVAAGALILKPAPATYRSRDLQGQFDELTARAETLVSEATGLHSTHGRARAKVTDRAGWAAANVRSVERLVGPAMLELQHKRGAKLGGPSLVVGRAVAGTQLGLMLAYMATRVLGQYDLLINDDDPEDQDLVSYVGPNIVAVEAQYGFDPSEFRLWLALHEVTHRLQFTAVPWLRDHFVGLVSELLGPLSGDPSGLAELARRVTDDLRAGRNPTREGGVIGMLATPEQRIALSRISGMMSLLEGQRRTLRWERAPAQKLFDEGGGKAGAFLSHRLGPPRLPGRGSPPAWAASRALPTPGPAGRARRPPPPTRRSAPLRRTGASWRPGPTAST
jgi:coenzyme F420 biosynthesis associated uncharacterized protein